MFVGNVYAKMLKTTEATNNLSMDTVDISLEEYMESNNGDLVLFEPSKFYSPGDKIQFVSQVKNLGVDSYIRLKVTFNNLEVNNDNNARSPLSEMIHFASYDETDWVYKNGYLYCTDVLKEGETASTFEVINIPLEWDNSYANHQFDVDITAEAIQSKNFEVDITSEDPWGSIQPQKTVRSRLNN